MGTSIGRIESHSPLGRCGASRQRVLLQRSRGMDLRRLKQDGSGKPGLRDAVLRVELRGMSEEVLLLLQALQRLGLAVGCYPPHDKIP